jgi:hypothetical protein
MAKFLIEVPHEADQIACAEAVKLLLSTGSHFLTNADWGCEDGEHKAWLLVEMGSKEEALAILPVAYRSRSKVVALNKFTIKQMDEALGKLGKT